MLEVPLSQGKYAWIDNEDLELIMRYNWYYCAVQGKRSGYAISNSNKDRTKPQISMHRLIMNPPTGMVVDHKNGNGLDNRRENLRICTPKQNKQNTLKRKPSSSRYKGVSYKKTLKKYQAGIRLDGKLITLGYFKDEADAAEAYNKAALIGFREYASLNKVPHKVTFDVIF